MEIGKYSFNIKILFIAIISIFCISNSFSQSSDANQIQKTIFHEIRNQKYTDIEIYYKTKSIEIGRGLAGNISHTIGIHISDSQEICNSIDNSSEEKLSKYVDNSEMKFTENGKIWFSNIGINNHRNIAIVYCDDASVPGEGHGGYFILGKIEDLWIVIGYIWEWNDAQEGDS